MESKLLINQTFTFDKISVEEKSTTMQINVAMAQEIPRVWEAMQKQAHEQGQKAYDGLTYRINTYDVRDDCMHLELAELSFSIRRVTGNILRDGGELPEDQHPRGFFAGSLVMTKDNHFLFGKKGGTTLSLLKEDLFGGMVQKDEHIITTAEDLRWTLENELEEEAGITPEYITSCTVEALVSSTRSDIGLIALMTLDLTKEEAQQLFEQRKDDEMTELVCVPKEDVIEHLIGMGSYMTCLPPVIKRLFPQ